MMYIWLTVFLNTTEIFLLVCILAIVSFWTFWMPLGCCCFQQLFFTLFEFESARLVFDFNLMKITDLMLPNLSIWYLPSQNSWHCPSVPMSMVLLLDNLMDCLFSLWWHLALSLLLHTSACCFVVVHLPISAACFAIWWALFLWVCHSTMSIVLWRCKFLILFISIILNISFKLP